MMTGAVLERLLAAMNRRGLCASDAMVALAVMNEQGLRVICPHDRAVLSAMASVSREELRYVSQIGTISLADACEAEIVRRKMADADEREERAALLVG